MYLKYPHFILVAAFLLHISFCGLYAAEKYWFYFKDKGAGNISDRLRYLQKNLPERCRLRRAKTRSGRKLCDETDLAVHPAYLNNLRAHGITPVVVSKWLNAVSAYAGEKQLAAMRKEPYILSITRVGFAVRKRKLSKTTPVERQLLNDYYFDYGPSLTQNRLIHVPELHNLGFYGQGVRIAVFDTGFRLNHEAFDHLKVAAAYDFIHGDKVVDNEPVQDGATQNRHGSLVLSIIAGFRQGKLIGPAFKSSFLLAKTEDESSETPVEEDYWIAAAEWADSLGAHVISSSLGYLDWYFPENMDGRTAPITIAADLAVQKGIIVVTSAGNEGNSRWGIIAAPADGDSVIAVGAVNASGSIAPYSSAGPTADGRIKPDVVAMGTGVTCINTPPKNGTGQSYTAVSGTSASCPLVAGVAAIILSAHPDLSPMQVRDALLYTADRATHPDNRYGYGLVNAREALFYWDSPPVLEQPQNPVLVFPNPFFRKAVFARFLFTPRVSGHAEAHIYNVLGQHVTSLGRCYVQANQAGIYLWDGLDQNGNFVNNGIYFCQIGLKNATRTIKFTFIND